MALFESGYELLVRFEKRLKFVDQQITELVDCLEWQGLSIPALTALDNLINEQQSLKYEIKRLKSFKE
jgi:hypothetical protein